MDKIEKNWTSTQITTTDSRRNLNRLITSENIELVLKKSSNQKSLGSDGFNSAFYYKLNKNTNISQTLPENHKELGTPN